MKKNNAILSSVLDHIMNSDSTEDLFKNKKKTKEIKIIKIDLSDDVDTDEKEDTASRLSTKVKKKKKE